MIFYATQDSFGKGWHAQTNWLASQILDLPAEEKSIIKLENFSTFGFTDISRHRSTNQDRALIAYSASNHTNRNWFLAVVCDGVGGNQASQHAAALASATIVQHTAELDGEGSAQAILEASLSKAHLEVLNRFGGKSSTTVVALLVKGFDAALGWAGDSRAYEFLDSITAEQAQITTDDTLGAALNRASIGISQQLNDDIAERLSQAIGADMPFRPNCTSWIGKAPEATHLLLCTDGVWKPLSTALTALVSACSDRSELARRLLLSSEWLGGNDNATAILLPSIPEIYNSLRDPKNWLPPDNCAICLPGGKTIILPNLATNQNRSKRHPSPQFSKNISVQSWGPAGIKKQKTLEPDITEKEKDSLSNSIKKLNKTIEVVAEEESNDDKAKSAQQIHKDKSTD
ncbi:PP2C family protein-serine/threonine phosphatase [Azohydromonas lata]|uniref:PP2C family protein-serine/threonine phosphatase n=1 Tax=Azohydromonas lata TaxID=45677 RepID=A0ABU5IK35_9BURK|nr:PP2C family protein-serine/threonine phosphatase [Azohydromonas lata]MDZ5459246.1 PP2C family protein-serine/threonine phosphatase [Azohydromonas lata]